MNPRDEPREPTPTEIDLIRRWVDDGCEAAARELVVRFHPRVAAIIRQRHRQAEDWPDLEQQTFTKVFQNLPRYRPDKPLEHWISRIALNVCRECWRKRSSRPELRWADLSEGEQAAFEQVQVVEDAEGVLENRDAHSLMLRLMEELSETDRLIVSLIHLEGWSAPEVAERLGIAKTAVRVRAFRARKRLEKRWKRLREEGA